jgi:hypothetical protein
MKKQTQRRTKENIMFNMFKKNESQEDVKTTVISNQPIDVELKQENIVSESVNKSEDIVSEASSIKEENDISEEDKGHFLTPKDIKSLKNSNYENESKKYNKIFIIKNKKTKQIVEVKAASTVHACKFIGWRPRQTILIEEKREEVKEVTQTA